MKRRILIMEQDVVLADALSLMLVEEGFDVYCAPIPDQQLIISFKPDLILLGEILASIDNYTFCRELKESLFNVKPCVILISESLNVKPTDAIRYCLDDYVTKPFEMEYLLKKLKDVSNRYPFISSDTF